MQLQARAASTFKPYGQSGLASPSPPPPPPPPQVVEVAGESPMASSPGGLGYSRRYSSNSDVGSPYLASHQQSQLHSSQRSPSGRAMASSISPSASTPGRHVLDVSGSTVHALPRWDALRHDPVEAVHAFYDRYYPAHPFLPPRDFNIQRIHTGTLRLDSLLVMAMVFVGERFLDNRPPDATTWHDMFAGLEARTTPALDGDPLDLLEYVQAKLLFSLAVYSSGDRALGREYSDSCREICLSDSTVLLSRLEPGSAAQITTPFEARVWDESRVRTLWQVFCTDSLFYFLAGEPVDSALEQRLLAYVRRPTAQYAEEVMQQRKEEGEGESEGQEGERDITYDSLDEMEVYDGESETSERRFNSNVFYIRVNGALVHARRASLLQKPSDMDDLKVRLSALLLLVPGRGVLQRDPQCLLATACLNLCVIFFYSPRTQASFPFVIRLRSASNPSEVPLLASQSPIAERKVFAAATNIMAMVSDVVTGPNTFFAQSPLIACCISMAAIVQASIMIIAATENGQETCDAKLASRYSALARASLDKISHLWETARDLANQAHLISHELRGQLRAKSIASTPSI